MHLELDPAAEAQWNGNPQNLAKMPNSVVDRRVPSEPRPFILVSRRREATERSYYFEQCVTMNAYGQQSWNIGPLFDRTYVESEIANIHWCQSSHLGQLFVPSYAETDIGNIHWCQVPNCRPSYRPKEKKPKKWTNEKAASRVYDDYLTADELQLHYQTGSVVEGILRINVRGFEDAYVTVGEGNDVCISGLIDRNRALNGDKVVVLIKAKKKWRILHDVIRNHWHQWGKLILDLLFEKTGIRVEFDCSPTDEIIAETKNDENVKESRTESKDIVFNGNKSRKENKCESNGKCVGPQKKTRRKKSKKENKNSIVAEKETKREEIAEQTHSSNNNITSGHQRSFSLPKAIRFLTADDFLKFDFGHKCIQRTGKVVALLEKNHPRVSGGKLKFPTDQSSSCVSFIPNDQRVPRMTIPVSQCPSDFYEHPDFYALSLFLCEIIDWPVTSTFPTGKLQKKLGQSGEVDVETEVILIENQVDYTEFDDSALIGLPIHESFRISPEEFLKRRDFTNECVFTIDPATARDLDDALSIKLVNKKGEDPKYEVGVHIADVTAFLKAGTPLDEVASRRATSFYLVQKVIPMLPRVLCEKLCSLNPGESKLTFSVVWLMDADGNILEANEWFGKTIINSNVKLSYELAQNMIDEPDKLWNAEELPRIYSDKFSYKDISWSVNHLNMIASNLRRKRFESGALRIDKLKVQFVLDEEMKMPVGFTPYEYRQSNALVEEFMLLANMAVARKIYEAFPKIAFLRRHPSPNEKMLNEFKEFCLNNLHLNVETDSSGSLQSCISVLFSNNPIASKVISHNLLKSMKQALYFCPGREVSTDLFHHYALNVPLYTHFTSPIRRYPDIIVHRLLAATLNTFDCERTKWNVKDLHCLASHCNDRKNASRLVSEQSCKLFLTEYIRECGFVMEQAVVIHVFDYSIDVMILNFDQVCRIYLDHMKSEINTWNFDVTKGISTMTLEWKEGQVIQNVKPFDQLLCKIIVNAEDMKWNVLLLHPFSN